MSFAKGWPKLPEVKFGEHRWAMPRATIPYAKPPLQITHQAAHPVPNSPFVVGATVYHKSEGKAKILSLQPATATAKVEILEPGPIKGFYLGCYVQNLATAPWPAAVMIATQKLPTPPTSKFTTVVAATKQDIIDAVEAVDNVAWCDIVEDNAAGKIHILVREEAPSTASRSEIIDAILRTKPASVRAVGPIHMNGAAFQFVTKAELDASIAGRPIQLYGQISDIKIEGTIYHDERPTTVVTSRVRVCAKCGNQSKHAESETSMGLCFDCFEARR